MSKLFIKTEDFEFSVEGTDKFVEKHFVAFKKEFLGGERILRSKKTKADSLSEEKKTRKDSTDSSLLNFYREKNPSTHYDKIVVFGYYLSENQNKETFTEESIEECYKELIRLTKLPGNLQVTLQDTIRNTGYIKKAGKGSYKLSPTGINHVTHELPAGTKE